jgi:hypothetical protein
MIDNPATGYARGHSNGYDSVTVAVPTLTVPFAWGNYLLAEKSGRAGALWAVLTLIPVLGLPVTVYLIYSCIIRLLDRQRGMPA